MIFSRITINNGCTMVVPNGLYVRDFRSDSSRFVIRVLSNRKITHSCYIKVINYSCFYLQYMFLFFMQMLKISDFMDKPKLNSKIFFLFPYFIIRITKTPIYVTNETFNFFKKTKTEAFIILKTTLT